jgi:hypothetical protein
MEATCGHRCPAHPDWIPCQLQLGHSTVIGHRDSDGSDVRHVWQDSGHGGDPVAERAADALRAAVDAFNAD